MKYLILILIALSFTAAANEDWQDGYSDGYNAGYQARQPRQQDTRMQEWQLQRIETQQQFDAVDRINEQYRQNRYER